MERACLRPCIVISRCIEIDPCHYDGSKISSPSDEHLMSVDDCIPACPKIETCPGIPLDKVK